MAHSAKTARRRRALWDIVGYGLASGALIALLKVVEYRFLVVQHSLEIYGGLIAVFFAALGIWLGRNLAASRRAVDAHSASADVPVSRAGAFAAPFTVDEARVRELGVTPRELEILGLIAAGLSNREIAGRLFVSENTVKTHSSRLFDKLGAKRRTQAVQLGKVQGLLP